MKLLGAFGLLLGAFATLLAAACAPQEARESGVTIAAAMQSTVDGVAAAQREIAKAGVSGYQPCDITATFSVTANHDHGLSVAAAIPQSPVSLGAKADGTYTFANTVTADFKSPDCIKAMMVKPTVLR